jgi:hypothetical protein
MGMQLPHHTMVQHYEHFVLQHVWITGGTEICSLAKLNGWYVPNHPGYTEESVASTTSWPKQDYQLIGNKWLVNLKLYAVSSILA